MDDAQERPGTVTIGVPKERVAGERRVAMVPDVVPDLLKLGLTVVVESGAGQGALLDDEQYFDEGARIESSAADVYGHSEIVIKVQPPLLEEVEMLQPGTLLICFLDPSRDGTVLAALQQRGVTLFSFNLVPRTTKAQSMDAMSSMSTIAGYKAVVLAADTIGRIFPLLMTAAGTIQPARVIVIGAGVAGLQALATARRLGAVTAACDARPAVREQIQSVGASFIDMSVPVENAEGAGGYARAMEEDVIRQERDAIRDHIENADVVISTAQVPGAAAPILIDEAMVREMRSGSVIVDLAAATGGNCELSEPDTPVNRHGVTILAPTNLTSEVPIHASQMYSRNILSVLKYIVKDGAVRLDPEDEIIQAACPTGVAAGSV